MANEELVKPENSDFSYRLDHFTGIRHNYELFPSHDYNSAFEQLLDTNLQIGVSSVENEVWNRFQGHKGMNLQDSGIQNDETKEGQALGGEQIDRYLHFPDNDHSGTCEVDKSITVAHKKESDEINDNLELGFGHSMNSSMKLDTPPPSLQRCSLRDASPENEMVVGMEFSDVNACRRAMRNAAISLRFEMHTLKSDKTRFTAKCVSEGCPWRIHCAKLPNESTFTIRTIHGSHTCGGKSHLGHQQASVQWVADVVEEKLKENPKLKPKEILEEIHRVHGIALSYKQAWRAKERIMATLRGSFEEEYSLRGKERIMATLRGSSEEEYSLRGKERIMATIRGSSEEEYTLRGKERITANLRGSSEEEYSLRGKERITANLRGSSEEEYSLRGKERGSSEDEYSLRGKERIAANLRGSSEEEYSLRGKERIMATLRESFEEEYSLLPRYCDEIRRTNPGSIALVHGNPIDGSFQHLFISFQASISGFINACRPLIALDKTFLKRKYEGTLLLATGFDGDGAVLPLAFAIVNEDNDSNWHRFLSELHKILEVNSENMPKLTILSSREKSIVDGVEANFPTASHGFCVHYLTERFRREFKSPILLRLLWEAAHALTIVEFKSKINQIQQLSSKASLWIQDYSPALWASSYFEGTRFGQLTANVITVSLSDWIRDATGLPIIQMMECFHQHLMSLFKERRETSSHWSGILVPSAEKQVVLSIEQSLLYRVYRGNEAEFEVKTVDGNVLVDIKNHSCSCRRWQIHGLPCSHAAKALLSCKEDVYSYTEGCFTVENYRRTYAKTVEPVSERAKWKGNGEYEIRTPRVISAVKRRKRRLNGELERVKRVVHCSRCNQTGHFRTTCSALM